MIGWLKKAGADARQKLHNATRPAMYHRDDDARLWSVLGQSVSTEKALSFSAFWRGTQYLSGVIAAIPWTLQKYEADGETLRRVRGHAIDTMLSQRANPLMSAYTARQTMLAHRITHGAGYAEIQRTMDGRPIAYWPIEPDRVRPLLAPDRSLIYMVRNSGGDEVPIAPESMLHFPGLGFNGVTSYSVIAYARRTIAAGVAGDEFATSLWENSAMPGGMLTHPESLSETAWNRLRQQFEESHVGAAKRGRPMIGEEGLTWNPFAIPPEDAQFLENRQFTIEEAARWLGIPPHKMMDNRNATYSNVEEQNLEVIGDTIVPIIESLEQEANYKLLGIQQARTMATQMDVAGLARGNFKARSEWLRAGFDMGGISPNRVAREFGEPPTPGGNSRFVQMNLQTVAEAVKPKTPAPDPQQQETPAPAEAKPDDVRALAVALFRNAAAPVVSFQDSVRRRHAAKTDAQWMAVNQCAREKFAGWITLAVCEVAHVLGAAESDALLLAEVWAEAEAARFAESRAVTAVGVVASDLIDALDCARQRAKREGMQ